MCPLFVVVHFLECGASAKSTWLYLKGVVDGKVSRTIGSYTNGVANSVVGKFKLRSCHAHEHVSWEASLL